MNNVLLLSGDFTGRPASRRGRTLLPPNVKITASDLERLARDLESVKAAWPGGELLEKVIVAVRYKTVVAKSNRVQVLLKEGRDPTETSIVGARYEGEGDTLHHVITHYVSNRAISDSVELLRAAKDILLEEGEPGGNELLESLWKSRDDNRWNKAYGDRMRYSTFAQLLHDACYVDSFESNTPGATRGEQTIVTLYETERSASELLEQLGIHVPPSNVLGNSALMTGPEYSALLDRAPYLVAMETIDINEDKAIDGPGEDDGLSSAPISIPDPTDEPTIGVIDTPFEEDHPPYFSKWVEARNLVAESGIHVLPKDYRHGTCVSSLIVDAETLNPWLKDGCGRFRVRHFGIALSGGYSSFAAVKQIERIVSENTDIKVWNLSLGSMVPTEQNFISPEAAALDEIQSRYHVIFVVAGTNDWGRTGRLGVGSPADSVNALVVNAVRRDGSPASYTRRGPVLRFFRKPDVAYYGGDYDERLSLCCGTGQYLSSGTSFAAPLVARKVGFLVYRMQLPCETAKALIIDAAAGWGGSVSDETGYGVVPIDIGDILATRNDEIRFVINGKAESYETYNYRLPVPKTNDVFPYIARATLCYSPECNRNQGVDYTATELDLHFGRLKGGNVLSLKQNTQGELRDRTKESEARRKQRKWDNVKHITDKLTVRPRARKAYDNPMWGVKIRKTSRLQHAPSASQPFSLVVTLREVRHQNRYRSFIQQCVANAWSVTELDVEQLVDVYEEAQTDIEWDE